MLLRPRNVSRRSISGCSASSGQIERRLRFAESANTEHVEHKHAVVSGHRAPALGDDVRMRNLGLVADALDVIDDVVRVFLERVIDARFKVGLRAVVVDTQAAAHVHEFQTRAGAFQFNIDARRLADGGLHLANISDLASEVEVEKLQRIGHAEFAKLIEHTNRFADGKAELGTVPAG